MLLMACGATAKPTPLTITGRDWIAFTRLSDSADGDIHVMRTDGSQQTQLTDAPGLDAFPSWSPDGRHLAFVSHRDGNPNIYVMNLDGSGQTRLTSGTGNKAVPQWSPDGKRIAYVVDRNGASTLIIMNADGSNQIDIAPGNWPTWSPDGKQIIFTRDDQWPKQDIYVMNVDGSDQRALTQTGTASEGAWSPDGKQIAFVSGDYSNINAPLSWNEDIHVMNVDGSNQRRLTNLAGNDHWPPTWSPDGTQIAFTADGSQCTADTLCNGEIQVIKADGSGLTNLTNHPAYDAFPAWQP